MTFIEVTKYAHAKEQEWTSFSISYLHCQFMYVQHIPGLQGEKMMLTRQNSDFEKIKSTCDSQKPMARNLLKHFLLLQKHTRVYSIFQSCLSRTDYEHSGISNEQGSTFLLPFSEEGAELWFKQEQVQHKNNKRNKWPSKPSNDRHSKHISRPDYSLHCTLSFSSRCCHCLCKALSMSHCHLVPLLVF